MTGRIGLWLGTAALLGLPVAAFAYDAGDPCSEPGAFHTKNDTEGAQHLVCDGSEWKFSVVFDKDGPVGIGDDTPDSDLMLDVEGKVGATHYCDASGTNCFVPASVGNAAAAGPDRSIQFNNGSALAGASTFVYTSAGNVQLTGDSSALFAVGRTMTNPALIVDTSAGASPVTGVTISSRSVGIGAWISATSTGAESLYLASTGNTGTVVLYSNAAARLTQSGSRTVISLAANNTASDARFSWTGAADAALTAGTEAPSVVFDISQTRTHASNTAITLQRDMRVQGSTHAFASSGGTITNSAAFSVDPGDAGTNATITNLHGIYVPSKTVTGTVTNAYGLTVAAPTGASNNYAAQFTGNVGISSNSPDAMLHVNTSSAATKGVIIRGSASQIANLQEWQDSSGTALAVFSSAGWLGVGKSTPGAAVDVDGDIFYTGAVADVSDRRMKENINPLTDQLAKVTALQPLSFTMKGSSTTELGLIAQDVEPLFPELVNTKPEGMKTLNYVGLIAPLVEAIQEQQRQIDRLRSENKALLDGLDRLEKRLESSSDENDQ